jgi:MYXO-CTERM domain-containing protein
MRIASTVVGILCLLVGCIWFLQGINVLPGSFMTGQAKWAVYGALLGLVGIGILVFGRRRRA